MNIALLGLPRSGKTTVFKALTGLAAPDTSHGAGKQQKHSGVIRIEDERLRRIAGIVNPKKTTFSEMTLIDMAAVDHGEKGPAIDPEQLGTLRSADAFLHVVRAFSNPSVAHPRMTVDPMRDIQLIESELISSDYVVAEKRLERMAKEHLEGLERELLQRCCVHLEDDKPLRMFDLTDQDKALIAGYTFSSMKPMLLLGNVDEKDAAGEAHPDLADYARPKGMGYIETCAEIEMEIGQLEPEDAREFLSDMAISEPLKRRFARTLYETLNLISFFTTAPNEVRAWTVPAGTPAVKAAGHVHSDMERGFIRAEVISSTDFIGAGGEAEAKKQNKQRVEGKDYIVQDGDVIYFRFHV